MALISFEASEEEEEEEEEEGSSVESVPNKLDLALLSDSIDPLRAVLGVFEVEAFALRACAPPPSGLKPLAQGPHTHTTLGSDNALSLIISSRTTAMVCGRRCGCCCQQSSMSCA